MIIAIRISGLVEVPQRVDETLFRMRLRRKYSSVLILDNEENMKKIRKVRDFIAYGKIDHETLKLLIETRGKSINKKKTDSDAIVKALMQQESKGKLDLLSLNLKPFFRLHPPRKGINSKAHFPIRKGVLGDNKEKINDLVRRML